MIKAIFIFIIISCPLVLQAGIKNKNFGDATVIQVTSIYDGDTFRANISGFPPIIGERIGIRLSGVDTPEIRGKCEKEKRLARKAKQHTVQLLRNARIVRLKNMRRGKYFRIVADVYADSVNVSKSLIKAGLAVPYYGKKNQKLVSITNNREK